MDNQHKKIKGYRDLSQAEIDLMNRIKAKGSELLELQQELSQMLQEQRDAKIADAAGNGTLYWEHARFEAAEPLKWCEIGKTDIQTGVMALVRAVAQPSDN